jgi:3-carboxy-cis,cis-muconate cycloisomerase
VSRHLLDALATTQALCGIFADAAVLRALLAVEAALARAQADTGIIPARAADAIAGAAHAERFDAAEIAQAARRSASIAIPLVEALTARVRAADEAAARFVHYGATSQDIVDTAMALLVLRALEVLAGDQRRLGAALRTLSDRHSGDVMVARTLLQPAVPTTFGLKVALWFHAQRRAWRRLDEAAREAAVLQFGGAAGTLASLGEHAPAVTRALALQLGLAAPAAPWQSDRDRIAALVAACGLLCGALGKMARDVSLLMQFEVAEAAEPGGGSSAMPHKQNPARSAIVLAAATRLPGLVSSSLAGLVQEHERSAGGWHAEWPVLADAMQTTGSALEAARDIAEGLTADTGRMRANLEAARGAVVSEWLSTVATRSVGRDQARAITQGVLARVSDGVALEVAVGEFPALRDTLSADELRRLGDPAAYLGQAEQFRRRLLEEG